MHREEVRAGDEIDRAEIERELLERDRRSGVDVPPAAEETVFLRRLYLDVVGILPTSAEIDSYLKDGSPDKRAKKAWSS